MKKKLSLATVVSVLALGVMAQSGAVQAYEPPPQAARKDVYCSGFMSSTSLPTNLHIVRGEDAVGRLLYSESDYIYLNQGRNAGLAVGQRYFVVRQAYEPNPTEAFKLQHEMYRRTWSGHWAGHVYQDIGQVEVKVVHETIATALVTAACDGLTPGDVLIPFKERPVPVYKPSDTFDRFAPPSGNPEGTIILGKDFAHIAGQGNVIYTNLGTDQGVKIGDYLRLFRFGRGTKYEGYKRIEQGLIRRYRGVPRGYEIPRKRSDLPREVLGEALVVHVDPKSSTAVITYSLREAHPGDFAELEPPVPAPQAQLSVVPASISPGGLARLTWRAKFASEVEVRPGIGRVSGRGSATVNPTQTTTYTLTARGPSGSEQATATLQVVQPQPPPAPPPAPAEPSLDELFAQYVQDIFFEFNKAEIRPEAAATLQRVAEFLQSQPQARILIEGHCDEIGSDEYNLALGVRRAAATKNYLISLGVNAEQLETLSLGKTQPFCTESREEACRQLNRRAHFVLQR